MVKIGFAVAVVACLSSYVSGPMALVGGFLFSYFIGHPFRKDNGKAVNLLLKIAVIGLGFGMNVQETLAVGKEGFTLTVVSIAFTLLAGFLIGKLLNLHRKTSYLISSGTAICGGSAIAAISPVINASEKDISVSLGVIFLLNSVALLIFPSIGGFIELSEHQFGMWSAIAIHDTSSVVGAAYAYGDEALKVATTVKLSRALWVIPISILSIFLFKGKNKPLKIPWFILLFIGAIVLNSYYPLPAMLGSSIRVASRSTLVLTLFLIGAGLSVDQIKTAGWKPMVLGIALWVLVSVLSLLAITLF